MRFLFFVRVIGNAFSVTVCRSLLCVFNGWFCHSHLHSKFYFQLSAAMNPGFFFIIVFSVPGLYLSLSLTFPLSFSQSIIDFMSHTGIILLAHSLWTNENKNNNTEENEQIDTAIPLQSTVQCDADKLLKIMHFIEWLSILCLNSFQFKTIKYKRERI